MLIDWNGHTKSESDLFLYTRNLENERLKPVFEIKIIFWICVLVLWIILLFFAVEKLVWNVCIKAFWHTSVSNVLVQNPRKFAKNVRAEIIKAKLSRACNGSLITHKHATFYLVISSLFLDNSILCCRSFQRTADQSRDWRGD